MRRHGSSGLLPPVFAPEERRLVDLKMESMSQEGGQYLSPCTPGAVLLDAAMGEEDSVRLLWEDANQGMCGER